MHTNTNNKQIELSSINNSPVLIRTNYDLPSLEVPFRIENSLETIKKLVEQGNSILIASHWARPKDMDPELSLSKMMPTIKQVFATVDELKSHDIIFCNQYVLSNDEVIDLIDTNENSIIIFENLRYDPRETSKDEAEQLEMAHEYAALVDYYVDEAFPLAHRKHALNDAIKNIIPFAYGVSHEEERKELSIIARSPQEPMVVIAGGAKLATKVPVLEKLAGKADHILVAGLICYTLLAAKGIEIEGAHIDQDALPIAEKLLATYEEKIILPEDFIFGQTPDGKRAPFDIGPQTIAKFGKYISEARSLFWNGPLGYYEAGYTHGTEQIAQLIINNPKCYSVIGGGDIITSLPADVITKFDFISAGGGATLDYLAHAQ